MVELTFNNFHLTPTAQKCQLRILKDQLATQWIIQIEYRAEFWEVLPDTNSQLMPGRNSQKSAPFSSNYIKWLYIWLWRISTWRQPPSGDNFEGSNRTDKATCNSSESSSYFWFMFLTPPVIHQNVHCLIYLNFTKPLANSLNLCAVVFCLCF